VTEHRAHLERLEQELQEPVHTWRLRPVVDALQALRGVQFTVAVTIVAELGDLTRFDKPSQRMSSLGLTPSEYSTGDHRRQGAITKTGNAHARRALIEGAWAYPYPAQISRHLPWRLERRPKAVQDLS
jgi:transposase